MNEWLSETAGGLVVQLHVQPGAKRSEWAGLHGGALKVRLAAPPIDGRANAALIAFVAETLNLPRSAVCLIAGENSRHKRLRLDGIAADQVGHLLLPTANLPVRAAEKKPPVRGKRPGA